jgi:hypothetical protein
MTLPLDQIRFRASSLVELKRLADLDAAQRAPFVELESDPNFYGLFIPRPPLTTNLQAVERETAELFLSLATPSRVSVDDHVIDLVLDGFLEIESDGTFVCGADAFSILCDPISSTATHGLSRDALLHAQDLEVRDARELTLALYLYNRIPLTPFWKSRFPNRDAILAHLGATHLAGRWTASKHDHWLSWSSRMTSRDDSAVTYKLYVSPRPERIRDAFDAVVRVLSEVPETAFKIGDSAAGLLRPDKLVLYFTAREQLDEVADALRRELSGCDAQGVPFTAALDDDGLLSWGIDPPESDRPLRWLDSESWRFWIAQRLGAALSVAMLARNAAIEPWRFAIERVRRAGVDVETWTPSPQLWSRA